MNSKIKIGIVDYLNAWPLTYAFTQSEFTKQWDFEIEIIPDYPSRLSNQLNNNDLDIALTSSIELARNNWYYSPDLCIASEGKVQSILLFLPSQKNQLDIKSVYIDQASRSSVAMLKFLFQLQGKKSIQWHEESFLKERIKHLNMGEAMLVIGDLALELKAYPHIDLGELYYQTTKRSMVYALWCSKSPFSNLWKSVFLSSFEFGKKNYTKMRKNAQTRFKFTEPFIDEYWNKAIKYNLTPKRLNDFHFFSDNALRLLI